MDGERKNYRVPYSIMMVAVGIAMLGWAIPFGFANYRLDQCGERLQVRFDEIDARIAAARDALQHK